MYVHVFLPMAPLRTCWGRGVAHTTEAVFVYEVNQQSL